MALLRVQWRGLLVTAFLSLVSLETFTAQPLISAPLPYHVQFAGTVLIDGHPADPGTYVQIVVFRAGGGYTVCGDTTVQAKMEPTSSGTGKVQVVAYAARLQSSAACLNPANTYSFYVNGIYAGRMGFPGTSMPGYLNLSVTRAALRTNLTQGGVRLVWISGIVTDSHARTAPDGTPVTAEAVGASCRGTAQTKDLLWVPKFDQAHPVGALGYYVLGIEMTKDCVDRPVTLRVHADGSSDVHTVQINTPPYGGESVLNLAIQ